jgi:hypothetical protein
MLIFLPPPARNNLVPHRDLPGIVQGTSCYEALEFHRAFLVALTTP